MACADEATEKQSKPSYLRLGWHLVPNLVPKPCWWQLVRRATGKVRTLPRNHREWGYQAGWVMPQARNGRGYHKRQKRLGGVQLQFFHAPPARHNDARPFEGAFCPGWLRGNVPLWYIQVEGDGLLETLERRELPWQGCDLKSDSDRGLWLWNGGG